jgi:hypothetical protein
MNEKDFKTLKKVFVVAQMGLKNDEHLGDWLVELGACLIALGVQQMR